MTLGKRIKDRRQALQITQEELAKAVELSPQHISAIEQDKREPSIRFLAKLAEEMGVSIDYLVTGKEWLITDTIPAIKADKQLNLESKRALIALTKQLHKYNESEVQNSK